jgi:hypothetical protein
MSRRRYGDHNITYGEIAIGVLAGLTIVGLSAWVVYEKEVKPWLEKRAHPEKVEDGPERFINQRLGGFRDR